MERIDGVVEKSCDSLETDLEVAPSFDDLRSLGRPGQAQESQSLVSVIALFLMSY
jgi:hypothetical protein